MRRLLLSMTVVGLLTVSAGADDPKPDAAKPETPKPAAKKPEGPPEYDVAFWDGSNVVVTVDAKELPVKTKYGTTTIPWADVRRMEFDGPIKDGQPRPTTAIETKELSLKGAISFDDVKVKTKQFGDTTLKFAIVKSMRRINVASGTIELALKADKYAKQGWPEWFDTGITLTADSALEITATGEIDLWPQTPGQYKCSAKGNGSMVAPPPGGDALLRMGFEGPPGAGTLQRVRLSAGMIVGKIGETGKPFLIGDKYPGKKAPAAGKLYLIIAPSNWGNDSAGEYKVTIKAGA